MSIIKKIGSILCLFAIASISALMSQDASVTLQVLSQQHVPITRGVVATPFIIQVVVTNSESNAQPEIGGISQLQVFDTRQEIRTTLINHTQTKASIYTYLVQALKPGDLTIGPVKIPQTDLVANAIKLPIDKQTQQAQSQNQKSNSTSPIEWSFCLNKHIMYVGERAAIELRARHSDLIDVSSIELFRLPDIRLEVEPHEKTSVEHLHGAVYTIKKWSGFIYPQKEGEYVLPSIPLTYTSRQSRHDIWAAFFGSVKQYVIRTKPETIKVLPLPENKTGKPCLAVATVTQFRLLLQKESIKQGEAVGLSLVLEGQGNLKDTVFLQLQLPDGLKGYQSKQATEETAQKSSKQFDYIVQGLSAGLHTIPAQEFFYFDPKLKVYKTIKSDTAVLMVLPDAEYTQTINEQRTDMDLESDSKELDRHMLEKELLECKEYCAQLPPDKKLSWSWLIVLSLMPLGLIGIYSGYTTLTSSLYRENKLYRKAFIQAHKELKRAHKEQQDFLIYGIFTKLLRKRLKSDLLVRDEQLYAKLEKALPGELALKWRSFSEKLLEISMYAPHVRHNLEQLESIFKDAYSWLKHIKNVV
jgi:hypothetical protein